MDSFARFHIVIPQPCPCCNAFELKHLRDKERESKEDFWVYDVKVRNGCGRCSNLTFWEKCERAFLAVGVCIFLFQIGYVYTLFAFLAFCRWYYQRYCMPYVRIQVPLPAHSVGVVERAIHASSVAEKGSAYRAHGTFIHHLSNMDAPELYKQSLLAWAPVCMMGFMNERNAVRRVYAMGRPSVRIDTHRDLPSEQLTFTGNPDIIDGTMKGTQLDGDEYGEENRVTGGDSASCEKVLAHQIGPDLIPTEVFQSTKENLKAGLAKRVKPLPFQAGKQLVRKIDKVVTAMIVNVFPADKIRKWREEHPSFLDMKSKKWSSERFRHAWIECLSDTSVKIEQEFQIKVNEALPAKGKAPRPIIQTGDKGQILMMLPVKCFEELLFEYFEEASIKHVSKDDAMARVAKHLNLKNGNVIEGDGSAWDACCNASIRSMTENRVIEHIIEVLGEDAEVPHGWMRKCLDDMKKKFIKGKAKVDNRKYASPLKVLIESIRQSGHRGTSAFNYFINIVCWLSVICKFPETMIRKVRVTGKMRLPEKYTSAFDGKTYKLRYSFEGDDSALVTTEILKSDDVEPIWNSLGFRMKLKFATDYFTFTGYDFLLEKGIPTGDRCPEIPRNISSSSWTCSSEAKSNPSKINIIGAAAMLSRAENFHQNGPMSRYFAELGLAHVKKCGDFGLGEDAAVKLGIYPVDSVRDRLHDLSAGAGVMSNEQRLLCERTFGGFTREQEAKLLSCSFDDPSAIEARYLIPAALWEPKNFETARR